jgi:hypothetical protein
MSGQESTPGEFVPLADAVKIVRDLERRADDPTLPDFEREVARRSAADCKRLLREVRRAVAAGLDDR